MTRLYFICFLFMVISCSSSTDFNSNLHRIMVLENSRCAPDSLYRFIRNPDDAIVMRSIRTLGQLRDTSAVDSLIAMLKDSRVPVVEETAFSLGQIGFFADSGTVQPRIEAALLQFVQDQTNPLVLRAVSEAIGRTGSTASSAWLVGQLKHARADVNAAAAYAIGRLAMRKFSDASMSLTLSPLIASADLTVRRAVVFASTRLRYREHTPQLLKIINDPDAQVRMDVVRALGSMGFTKKDKLYASIVDGLVDRAFNDDDWRVRVNAVNALSAFKFSLDDLKKIYFLMAFEGRKDKNTHVRVAAIRAIPLSYSGDLSTPNALLDDFTSKYLPASSAPDHWEILQALAKMFGDRMLDHPRLVRVIELMAGSENRYVRARTVEALAAMKSVKTLPLLAKALSDTFLLVQLEAGGAMGDHNTTRAREILAESIRTTTDATLLAVLAQSSAKIAANGEMLVPQLIEAFAKLRRPIDVEAQMTLFDVLGGLKSTAAVDFLSPFLNDSDAAVARSAAVNLEKITGTKVQVQRGFSESPVDFNLFLKIKSAKPAALLHTAKGIITLEFATDDAPLTVMNFVRLAESGYFNGNTLHRVVPNFVIQDGDPTGSGWGGPGYSIRAEFNKLTYDRGKVGMASAGPDTEGSQWFITHSATPHLDRRYTIFAHVKSGMEAADELQVGDVVDRVEIRWP